MRARIAPVVCTLAYSDARELDGGYRPDPSVIGLTEAQREFS
jgi:hypothetical protein